MCCSTGSRSGQCARLAKFGCCSCGVLSAGPKLLEPAQCLMFHCCCRTRQLQMGGRGCSACWQGSIGQRHSDALS